MRLINVQRDLVCSSLHPMRYHNGIMRFLRRTIIDNIFEVNYTDLRFRSVVGF